MSESTTATNKRYDAWTSFVRTVFSWRSRTFTNVKMGRLPDDVTADLAAKAKSGAIARPFATTDALQGYEWSQLPESVVEEVRDNFSFFNFPLDDNALLARAVSHAGKFAAASLGHPVKVVNVRMWSTASSSGRNAGANTWHRDGFPKGVLKIMIYLTPPSSENGTTEIQLEDGTSVVIEGPAGTILLFDNSLLHRGVPPSDQEFVRTIIEVTVVPALFPRLSPMFAGLNARYPKYPWR